MSGERNVFHDRVTMRETIAVMAFEVYETVKGKVLQFDAEAVMDMARWYPDDVQIYQIYE